MSENNKIYVTTSSQTIRTNVKVDNSGYYTEKAQQYAEQSEASAQKSQANVDRLLSNEDFINVSQNLDLIVEAGQKIEGIDLETILNAEASAKASSESALASAQTSTEQANISTAQATISTQKAIEVSSNVNLANNFASQSLNSSNIAKEQATISTNQATISTTNASNSLTYSRNAKTSEENALKYSNNAKTSETNALTYSNKAKGYLDEVKEIVPTNFTTLPIGSVISVNASASYTPSGFLPCNGAEYSKADFEKLWDNYFICQDVFDPESITVVGSPTITEDGIASWFNESNYIQATTIDYSKNWEIVVPFRTGSKISAQVLLTLEANSVSDSNYLVLTGAKTLSFRLAGLNLSNIDSFVLTENTDYIAKIGWDGSRYYLKISGQEYYSNSSTALEIDEPIKLGTISYSGWIFQGSIDLKQFKISVDGQTVFDCVKQVPLLNTCSYAEYDNEISTNGQCSKFAVKPLEYDGSGLTIVGSPTITSNGVASGLNNQNYVKTSKTITIKEKTRIKFSCNFPTKTTSNSVYCLSIPTLNFHVYKASSGYFSLYQNTSYGTTLKAENYETGIVDFELIFENNNATCFISQNGTLLGFIELLNVSYIGESTITFGQGAATLTSLDLKQVQIEVDGQTVFDCVEGDTFKVPTITNENTDLKNFVAVANGTVNDCLATWNTLLEIENYLKGV